MTFEPRATDDASAPPDEPRRSEFTLGQRLYGVLRAGLALGLLGYVGYVVRSQGAKAGGLPSLDPRWFAGSVVVLVVYYAALVENWRAVMSALEVPLGWRRAFRIIYLSNLAKYLPGGIWNLVGRVAMCKADGIPVATATLSLLVELTAQVAAMAVVAMVTLSSAVEHLVPFPLWYLLPVPILVVAGTHPRFVNALLAATERLTRRTLPRMTISYGTMLALQARFLGAWATLCVGCAMMGRAIGGPSAGMLDSALLHAGAISISWLVGLLAFIVPGGLGVREVLLTAMLEVAHPAALAAAVALVFRLVLVVMELVCFAIGIALRRR